jgi:putative ABC transport system permease protein
MTSLLKDFRYGARLLWRTPALTVIAVLTLALGIGANTAIFSVVHAIVVRPLPYKAPAELVQLYTQFPNQKFDRFWFSPPEYFDLAAQNQSYSCVGAFTVAGSPVQGGQLPVRAVSAYCTASLLPTIGVAPALGRFFTAEEDIKDAPQAVVMSHGLWQRVFGADPNILGKTIRVDSGPVRVVGVMPQGFDFPGDGVELWVPAGLDPHANRAGHGWSVIARLRPGISVAAARAEMQSLMAGWSGKFDHAIDGAKHPIVIHPLQGEIVGAVRSPLLVLQGAVLLVLLIACANISNLLLARAEARTREIAIRVALGAGRRRLLRQFLCESALLGILGGGLGLLLAWWGLDMLMAIIPSHAPRLGEVRIDGAVLLFTALSSIGTSFVFGLAPIIHTRGRDFQGALQSSSQRTTGGATRQRFRRALVVAETALAVVLVVGSGLMIRSFLAIERVDLGFDPNHLLTMRIELPRKDYPTGDSVVSLWTRVEERLAVLPGVRGTTAMTGLPPYRQINANDITFEGKTRSKDGPVWNVDYWQTVGDNYFQTMGIRMVRGRAFDSRDDPESAMPVVLINESMARRFWPGEDPMGKRVQQADPRLPWQTIVGIVSDVKQQGVEVPTGTEIYFPMRQMARISPERLMHIAVRAEGNPSALENEVRRAIAEIDPTLAIAELRTMDEVLFDAVAKPRFLASLLGALSAIALLLAAIGLYGVMYYSVAQRTHELGIRIALGAEPGRVRALVLAQGFRLAALGIVLGTGAALALNALLGSILRDLLFQVGAMDPATFTGVAITMALVGFLACFIPALRATRISPMTALRQD